MEFTTIFFGYGVYSQNKDRLKKMMSKDGFKWNASKMKLGVSSDVIVEAFKFFKCENRIDDNLKGRGGSTGVWEVGDRAVKIIMFDKKSEDEHLPVLLVYKGTENEFYRSFISECIKLGCEIGKVVETEKGVEEIFKKRVNIELVTKLDSVEGSKEVMKEMFINRVNELKGLGYFFSENFIKGWKNCIDKYGLYTDKMLYAEQQNNNVLNNNVLNNNLNNNVPKEQEKIQIEHEKIITGSKFYIRRLLT